MDAETLEAARSVAFRYLGYAARSQAEIERRLTKAEFAPDVVAAIVDEFTARGWLDDVKFAQDWVADRADRKRYGKSRLASELRNRGVDKETTQDALDTMDDASELARALAAARPKWRADVMNEADRDTLQSEKRKLAGFLQRRGFSWGIITQVFAELTANTE